MKQQNTTQNPWAGLASYGDPAKSAQKLLFCGRDSETYDVLRLIDDNFFVTLYGKSGIGKTSLLNAGVFPVLRCEQYTPLSIRLGISESSQTFQNIITSAIGKNFEDAGGIVKTIQVVEEQTNLFSPDYLWNWFARRRFENVQGQPTFPVVILDQFEEVFRTKELRDKSETLLTQLHYLIDESHALNDCIVNGEEYFYDFNFRFVISIREDDLYRLEDSIDNNSLTALKRCRYRLRGLSTQGSRNAILLPGNGLFRTGDEELIARSIITASRNKDDNSISTNMLSLICNRLYVENQRVGDGFITLSLVDNFIKGNPFEQFYNEATKGFSDKEKSFIEERLVDSSGRRNSITENDFLHHVPKGKKLLEGDTRILQRISSSSDVENFRIELIHDSFCEPLAKQKEKREKRKRMKWLLVIAGLALLSLAIVGFVSYQIYRAEKAKWKMMEIRARFVAEKGQQLIDEGDFYLARMLALEVLPKNLANPDKPYTPEAEGMLRDAFMHNNAILGKHANEVNSVSFSPDSKRIVSASSDGIVRIWDAETGMQIGEPLIGHADYVASACFSPDGKRIVSASDSTIRIWEAETGMQIGEPLTGHSKYVSFACFSPDGKRIVSASSDRTIRIWDVETGMQIGEPLEGHTGSVNSVSFNSDGKRILSASSDRTIRIWDAETRVQIGEPLEGHTGSVNSACFSPDGKRIVSASGNSLRFYGIPDDNTIRIWDAETGTQIGEPLTGHLEEVNSVSYSPDGKRIVSTSWDMTVRVWDAETGLQIGEPLVGHTSEVNSASFSPDDERIVSASSDGTVRIWNAETGRQTEEQLDAHKGKVEIVSFSPDGTKIASVSGERVFFSSFLSFESRRTIGIWDIETGKQIGGQLNGHTESINTVSFSPDGNRIVSASNDHTIRIWDAETGVLIGVLTGHTNSVCSARFSPDGKKIVSISNDRTIRIWDVNSGKQIRKLPLGQRFPLNSRFNVVDGRYIEDLGLYSARFSPDGKKIVSTSDDRTIKIWDVKTGRQIDKLPTGNENNVFSASFSPDGKKIISASSDNTIRIWDVNTGVQIGDPLEGHMDDVTLASFISDGKIVSVSVDGTIRIWDYPPLQELIDSTRKKFKNRKLTPEERRKYYIE